MTTSHQLPLERTAIEELIPHRDPFLFVDRVTETGPERLVGEWRVPEDGAWFAGHYPGNPILPGVLIARRPDLAADFDDCLDFLEAEGDGAVPLARASAALLSGESERLLAAAVLLEHPTLPRVEDIPHWLRVHPHLVARLLGALLAFSVRTLQLIHNPRCRTHPESWDCGYIVN